MMPTAISSHPAKMAVGPVHGVGEARPQQRQEGRSDRGVEAVGARVAEHREPRGVAAGDGELGFAEVVSLAQTGLRHGALEA